ncbi:hypothetical protein [Arenimonas oryziterrae]|uniref:Uncharacterized protein n=1 Tax=Arenimonas oryziterrae DSM 21050 = YC6267 TaxID=1121015 RepID=A0A091AV95_9GAMM|nr:hypothetical protein [Arenimonas oryziterrae]KFN42584.1 hypothetical protein N789_13165 [Arenimonas oryziterrae DSM 21050 = YC6267]
MSLPPIPPQKGLKSRQAKADALAADVHALARQYETMGDNMVARVADELNISARLVREILDQPAR